ncbi:MAG: helix-turn-helix domain-containing protein [Gammaproteobacteria bacterium]|nr:helix-turn-helix domain-containing protein [Gammaproteobacteria bacterium]
MSQKSVMSATEISGMMATRIMKAVDIRALGNSDRNMKDVAIDLVNASGWTYKEVAEQAYLAPTTVQNLVEEKTQFPRYDTIERIYRVFGVELRGTMAKVDYQYRLQPKKGR